MGNKTITYLSASMLIMFAGAVLYKLGIDVFRCVFLSWAGASRGEWVLLA